MGNPFAAFKNSFCDNCDERVAEGDNLWIYDGQKLCEECAAAEDWICSCGNFKKPDFDECFDCHGDTE